MDTVYTSHSLQWKRTCRISQENEARTVPIEAFFVKDFAFVDKSSSELTSIIVTMDSVLGKVQSLKDNIEGLRDKL